MERGETFRTDRDDRVVRGDRIGARSDGKTGLKVVGSGHLS